MWRMVIQLDAVPKRGELNFAVLNKIRKEKMDMKILKKKSKKVAILFTENGSSNSCCPKNGGAQGCCPGST